MTAPLVSDPTCTIAQDCGVLKADKNNSVIDDKGCLQQVAVNDFPVGRPVAETG